MYADEFDETTTEILDLLEQLTPEYRRVAAVLIIATGGRDAKAQTVRSILARIGAMNEDELDTLLVELQEPRAT